MSETKRYTHQVSFDGLSHRMVEFEHGEYVAYSDHVAALAAKDTQIRLQGENLHETAVKLERVLVQVIAKDAEIERLKQDNAVLSSAFHEVLADNHPDDSTFQEVKKEYIKRAMLENKLVESLLPHFLEAAGMILSPDISTQRIAELEAEIAALTKPVSHPA